MPNLSFRGQRELSTVLQLQQKDQNHTAISHCCLTRSQVGAKDAAILPILDCKYSNVKQKFYDHVKPITLSTKLSIATILPKFLH